MPKTTKLNSNSDLVEDLMTFSPFGALGQVFVMAAIMEYADAVIRDSVGQPSELSKHGEQYRLVGRKTWAAIASDVKQRCEAFYGRHEQEVANAVD